MGLITRCPACGTMFKVVSDQLKISEGWVRCGHCTEVFDATADLHEDSGIDLPAPAGMEARIERPPAEPDSGYDSLSSGYPSVQSQVDDSMIEGTPDPLEIDEQAQVLQANPLDQPFELRRADTGDVEAAGPHGFSKPIPLEPEPELQDLAFVRQARRRELWRRPGVRALLAVAALVLVAALAAQMAWRQRDVLAATHPEWRPWLARMCDALQCRVGPPHMIDAVAIETSSFNKLRGDTFRLNVTLKNQSRTPVAMPALELTLTDSQDQPVVRRVLQPSDFAPGTAAINATSDWSTSIAIAVNAAAAGGTVAGYRVLAFYP